MLYGYYTRGALVMKRKILFWGLIFLVNVETDAKHIKRIKRRNYVKKIAVNTCCDWKGLFNEFVQDLVDVNKTVFTSTDTLKIFTGVLPFYLCARFSDDIIHESFYEPGLHKNVSQMPGWTHGLANGGVTALAVTFSLFPLCPIINADLRRTSSLAAKGVLLLSCLRTFIKCSLKARSAFRPWHESYSNTQRCFGGFPSGHMAMSCYLSSLYGLQHGAKWGVPLSAFTAFSFIASLNSNRHYASQLVGGLGIGLIYGFASYKILNSRFGASTTMSFDIDAKNRPLFNLSYEF